MNEKKKLRRLPKCILSFVLTLALVFTLMLGITLPASAAGGDTVWTASKCEFCPADGGDNAKLVLTEVTSNGWSTPPESITIDLGNEYESIESFEEAYDEDSYTLSMEPIDDEEYGYVEESYFSFRVVNEQHIISEMEVRYNDGTDNCVTLKYSVPEADDCDEHIYRCDLCGGYACELGLASHCYEDGCCTHCYEECPECGNDPYSIGYGNTCSTCGMDGYCNCHFVNGYCEFCGDFCSECYADSCFIGGENTCSTCGLEGTDHDYQDGECIYCYESCPDCGGGGCDLGNGTLCSTCGAGVGNHNLSNGVCTNCGKPCSECYGISCSIGGGNTCSICGFEGTDHDYRDGRCYYCGVSCPDCYDNSCYIGSGNTCSTCGLEGTDHDYHDGTCIYCYGLCPTCGNAQELCMDCPTCGLEKTGDDEHCFVKGVCRLCSYECPHHLVCEECGKEDSESCSISIEEGKMILPLGDDYSYTSEDIPGGVHYHVSNEWDSWDYYDFDVYVLDRVNGKTAFSVIKELAEVLDADSTDAIGIISFVNYAGYTFFSVCDPDDGTLYAFVPLGDKIVRFESYNDAMVNLVANAELTDDVLAGIAQGLDKAKILDAKKYISETDPSVTLTSLHGYDSFVEYVVDAWENATEKSYTANEDEENYNFEYVWSFTIDGVETSCTLHTGNTANAVWNEDGDETTLVIYKGFDIIGQFDSFAEKFILFDTSDAKIGGEPLSANIGKTLTWVLANRWFSFPDVKPYSSAFEMILDMNNNYVDFNQIESGYGWAFSSDGDYEWNLNIELLNGTPVRFTFLIEDKRDAEAIAYKYDFAPEWYIGALHTKESASDLICLKDTENGVNVGKTFADIFGEDGDLFLDRICEMWTNAAEEDRAFTNGGKYTWTVGETVWTAFLVDNNVAALLMEDGENKVFFGDNEIHIDRFFIDTTEGDTKGHLFVAYKNIGENGEPIVVDLGKVVDGSGAGGQDGVTPQLRINSDTNMWEVSYDDGSTWTSLSVKATGDKGDQGIQGIQGEKGVQGDKGESGDTGITIAMAALALLVSVASLVVNVLKKKKA